LEYPFTERQLSEAQESFVQNDLDITAFNYDHLFVDQLRKDFETFYRPLSTLTFHEILSAHRPRDTGGSFAGSNHQFAHLSRSSKSWGRRCPKDSRDVAGYFKPYPSAKVKITLSDDTSETSELLFVPKDSRGPRTIVREPLLNLKAQMSFFDCVTSELQKCTRGHINFQDQSQNKELAQESSKTRKYATLDLKDASDRVSYELVRHIFRYSNGLTAFFKRYRTSQVRLPDGSVRRLGKVSGMGSGFTFPCMALVAYLSIVRTITNRTRYTYKQAMSLVYVYGDDILVPTTLFDDAVEALSKVGLKVNNQKSFRYSHFRESCGGDYYNGTDVGPLRLKLKGCNIKHSKANRTVVLVNHKSILQLERHCRNLVKGNFIQLAEYYYQLIEATIGKLPFGHGETPYLVRYNTFMESVSGMRSGLMTKVFLPVPDFTEHREHCPYHHLGKQLPILGKDSSALGSFGEVAKPHTVRYKIDYVPNSELYYLESV